MTKSRNIMGPRVILTKDQIDKICRLFPDHGALEIAETLGLQLHKVYKTAAKYGVKKSPGYRAGIRQHLANFAHAGKDCRFKKGQTAHNKGKKGPNLPSMMPTQFRAGQRPHNALPVGTIQPDFHGVMRVKVSEPRGWVYLHRARWEAAHGPIPRSHVVAFKNGNVAEWQLDNLELIHRSQLAKRNTIHRYPIEMKQVFRLIGKLKKVINEKQNTRSA